MNKFLKITDDEEKMIMAFRLLGQEPADVLLAYCEYLTWFIDNVDDETGSIMSRLMTTERLIEQLFPQAVIVND